MFWHFLYSADDAELAKSGTSADVSGLELGQPEKLNRDVNSWHIVLQNPTAAAVDFETSINWTQNGQVIARWPEKGPQTGQLASKESTVIDDSAFLVVLPDEALTLAVLEPLAAVKAAKRTRLTKPSTARKSKKKRGGR